MSLRTNPFSSNFSKHLVPTYLSFSSSPKYSSSHMYFFKFRKQRTKLSTKFLFNSEGTRWYSRNEILWSDCLKWYISFYIKIAREFGLKNILLFECTFVNHPIHFQCRFTIDHTTCIAQYPKLKECQVKLNLKLDFNLAVIDYKMYIWLERNLVEIIIKRHW